MNKPKNKLIIRNYTDLSDEEIMYRILHIISNGYVSKTKANGEQYCFHTVFGIYDDNPLHISVTKKGNTHTFYCYREEELRD